MCHLVGFTQADLLALGREELRVYRRWLRSRRGERRAASPAERVAAAVRGSCHQRPCRLQRGERQDCSRRRSQLGNRRRVQRDLDRTGCGIHGTRRDILRRRDRASRSQRDRHVRAARLEDLRHRSLATGSRQHRLADLRTDRVVSVHWQRDGRQNADDGNHDHQFDEREAGLCSRLDLFQFQLLKVTSRGFCQIGWFFHPIRKL